jgi:hypothetical protein
MNGGKSLALSVSQQWADGGGFGQSNELTEWLEVSDPIPTFFRLDDDRK